MLARYLLNTDRPSASTTFLGSLSHLGRPPVDSAALVGMKDSCCLRHHNFLHISVNKKSSLLWFRIAFLNKNVDRYNMFSCYETAVVLNCWNNPPSLIFLCLLRKLHCAGSFPWTLKTWPQFRQPWAQLPWPKIWDLLQTMDPILSWTGKFMSSSLDNSHF